MLKKFIYIIILFLFVIISLCYNKLDKINDIEGLQVLNDGRIKPLYTVFDTIKNDYNIYANDINFEWFAMVLFNKEKAFDINCFKLKKIKKLVNISGKKKMYSFYDILFILKNNIDILESIKDININSLNQDYKNLLSLYYFSISILDISNSFDLFQNFDSSKSKYEYICDISNFNDKLNIVNTNLDKNCTLIKFIVDNDQNWYNMYEFFEKSNFIKNNQIDLFLDLQNNYRKNSQFILKKSIKHIIKKNYDNIFYSYKIKINLELIYHFIKPFDKSIYFYILSLFVIFISFYINKYTKLLKIVSFYFFSTGVLLQLSGIFIRILITQRAPVTSLYESIIFIGFCFSFLLICYFNLSKSNKILLLGILTSLLLNSIANTLESGDSIKNLVSVLNTNFWLIIHVITISLGYVFCIICSILGHICLYIYMKKQKVSNYLIYSLNFFIFMALSFCFIGTILGGIWADQSWGRFWGWDPKENGALLIVLWLTLLLHAKLSKLINIKIFYVGIVLNNIVLSLSWFGVNLLNVGLHSYGFIENIGLGLIIFCFFEIFFICLCIYLNYDNKIFKIEINKNL
jgi:ABC-type transport system involved in cytochrome c biogenesis permease subunit